MKWKKWFPPPSFFLPISVIQFDFFVLLCSSPQLRYTFKTKSDKQLENYYLYTLGSSCREGMRFNFYISGFFKLQVRSAFQEQNSLHLKTII